MSSCRRRRRYQLPAVITRRGLLPFAYRPSRPIQLSIDTTLWESGVDAAAKSGRLEF